MSGRGIGDTPAVCRACGKMIRQRRNLRTHYQSQHPAQADRPLREMVAEEAPRRAAPAAGALVPVTVPAAPPVLDLPPLGVEDLDGLVLGVVDQLAGPAGMFPVQHLPALLVWREATAAFLRQVTR